MVRVVIVGGGFAGLEAAKVLGRAPVALTVVDSQNHHLFQPLLYQVAASTLSPEDIASPIRKLLNRQRNTVVVMAAAASVDLEGRGRTLTGGRCTMSILPGMKATRRNPSGAWRGRIEGNPIGL